MTPKIHLSNWLPSLLQYVSQQVIPKKTLGQRFLGSKSYQAASP